MNPLPLPRLLRAALTLACVVAPWAAAEAAPSVVGRWLTEKGDAVVEFFPCEDKVCGKLVWLWFTPPDGTLARDRKNPDEKLRSRTLCGLQMLGGFQTGDPNEWGGGWIYSPQTGETFKAKMKLEKPDVLKLRGYVGLPVLGQTQTWTRAPEGFPACGKG